jgi:prepilin-type N-terminal cleavage/methylation domain-containing protein
MKLKKNEKGFSLVELLVVVIIIAIVAAIAIPNLLASRRAANEASAISSLRTIHSAQATFQATTGGNVDYAEALGDLNTAGLIDPALSSGTKSGYDIAMFGAANIYCGQATADVQDTTGVRGFMVNQDGVIYSYATDLLTVDCDTATGVTADPITGVAIQ